MSGADALTHPLLAERGVRHGFGLRGTPPPPDVVRVKQVHGSAVHAYAGAPPPAALEADAIVSTHAGTPVGVVTADCVPVLVASEAGDAVAAVHAGWRGLACGVLPAAIAALRARSGAHPLVAAIGPHIGPCCYEVDGPVIRGLEPTFGSALDPALRASRAEHWWLDLAALATCALEACDVTVIDAVPEACTHCDAQRFHSYRRDGERAGRLLHWIAARTQS